MSLSTGLGIAVGVLALANAITFFFCRWQLEREKNAHADTKARLKEQLAAVHADLVEYKLGVEQRNQAISDLKESIEHSNVSANVSRVEIDRLRNQANKCLVPQEAVERVNRALDRLKGQQP